MNGVTEAQEVRCVKGVFRDTLFEITLAVNHGIEWGNHSFSLKIHRYSKGNIFSEGIEPSFTKKLRSDIDADYILIGLNLDDNLLPIKKIEVFMSKLGTEYQLEYTDDWHLSNLLTTSAEEFDAEISNAWSRVSDKETLMFIAMQNAQYLTYDLSHAIASHVIFFYKGIELGRSDLLHEKYFLFDRFEKQLPDLLKRRGGLREDGRQTFLSFYTVKWHVDLILRKFEKVIDCLEKIREEVEQGDYNKPSLSLNLSNAYLILGYAKMKNGDKKGAKVVWTSLYEYYRGLMSELPEKPFHPSHFNDTMKSSRALFLALWGLRGIKVENTKNPRLKNLNDDSIFKRTVRVNDHDEIAKCFKEFLGWCSSSEYISINKDLNRQTSKVNKEEQTLSKQIQTIEQFRDQIENQEYEIAGLIKDKEELSKKVEELTKKEQKFNSILRNKAESNIGLFRKIVNFIKNDGK